MENVNKFAIQVIRCVIRGVCLYNGREVFLIPIHISLRASLKRKFLLQLTFLENEDVSFRVFSGQCVGDGLIE